MSFIHEIKARKIRLIGERSALFRLAGCPAPAAGQRGGQYKCERQRLIAALGVRLAKAVPLEVAVDTSDGYEPPLSAIFITKSAA